MGTQRNRFMMVGIVLGQNLSKSGRQPNIGPWGFALVTITGKYQSPKFMVGGYQARKTSCMQIMNIQISCNLSSFLDLGYGLLARSPRVRRQQRNRKFRRHWSRQWWRSCLCCPPWFDRKIDGALVAEVAQGILACLFVLGTLPAPLRHPQSVGFPLWPALDHAVDIISELLIILVGYTY